MTRLRALAEAEAELVQAARYYEEIEPGLGRRFLDAIEEARGRIEKHPSLYRHFEGGVRRCRLRGFPYALIYRISAEQIEILAVMHLHRRPNYWRSRVRP